MSELVLRLRYTFGNQLWYVGTTTTGNDDYGDLDVLIVLTQLSDAHIRGVLTILSLMRNTWNIVLDCRIRSVQDLVGIPALESHLLHLFLRDHHGENPFGTDTVSQEELEVACRARISAQEQSILNLLPKAVANPERLSDVGRAVLEAAKALLVLEGHPTVSNKCAVETLCALTSSFEDVRQIYEASVSPMSVLSVSTFLADALALVRHAAHRAAQIPLADEVLLINTPSTSLPHPQDFSLNEAAARRGSYSSAT